MNKRKLKKVLKAAIAAIPEKTYIHFVSQGDGLTPEQAAKFLGGDIDGVANELTDHHEDYADETIKEMLRDALKVALKGDDDADPDEFFDAIVDDENDEFTEFRDACYDNDQSTVLKDHLRESHRVMVRFYFRDKGQRVELEPDSWNWEDEKIEAEARRLCKAAGIDYDAGESKDGEKGENGRNMRSVVREASYGGQMCVLAYIELSDFHPAMEHLMRDKSSADASKTEPKARVRLTFTDPNILMMDSLNGSGHDESFKGEVTIEFGYNDLDTTGGVMSVDDKAAGTGYSWSDDIAGVVKTYYKADPKVELLEA